MKQQVAIAVIALGLVGGTGTGFAVREMRSDAAAAATPTRTASVPVATPDGTPSTEPTPAESGTPISTTTPSHPALHPLDRMRITPGAVGPVRVGMSKQQAAATGYFSTDVDSEVCEGSSAPLEWTSNYYNALDVLTAKDGSITTIGIRNRGPKTRSGLEINSSYAEVRRVIGVGSRPEKAGYGQTGLFVNDGNAGIGFLFDATPSTIGDNEPVTFIEVTRGHKPGLMRDGC